ncbi:MAG: ABC transporter ATP-binding protein [Mycoplasmoidaceae bacterium]|nr:MAG: ABC transporter ATP-binding protein [Mycoplasmoidaceae bacterium]
MFKLSRYFKPLDWILLSLALIIIGCQVYFDLFLPDKIQMVMTSFTYVPASNTWIKPSVAKIWELAGYAICFVLGSLACGIVTVYLSSHISRNYAAYVRKNLFSHINTLSAEQIEKLTVPSLINRNTGDCSKAANGFDSIVRLGIAAPASAIGGIAKIVVDAKDSAGGDSVAIPISLITASAVILLSLAIGTIGKLVIPHFKKQATLIDDYNKKTRENITGIRVVRAFNTQDMHSQRSMETTNKIYKNDKFIYTCLNTSFPIILIIINFTTIAIYWVGGSLIHNGTWNTTYIPTLAKYQMLSVTVIFSFMKLVMLMFFVPNAIVSSKRINEVFSIHSTIVSGDRKELPNQKFKSLEFKNVSMRFYGAPEDVIHDVSFKVNAGETMAIIGATGCGKSIVISLIPRIYDSTGGEILINGIDIKEYDLETLRDLIGYVPQKNFLFNESIKKNIANGIINKKYSEQEVDEKVKWASKIASAEQFIDAMPDKYEYVISQNATNLSGGQKQRLAIARAIVRNPEMLIFDDSFSALDMATDQKVRDLINTNLRNTTKIIVAQRIGTILHADKILVLSEGKSIGFDNHKNLMKKCKTYEEIALSQLSRKELDNVKA